METRKLSWEKLQEEIYSQKELRRKGRKYTEPFSIASRSAYSERINQVMDWIGKGKKILDTGAGDGGIAERFRKRDNLVIALDLPRVIRYARKYHKLHLIAADAKHLPLKNESIDAIFMGELIEHTINTKRPLEECYRICKHGGSLIITTPNVASLKNRILLLFGKYWRPFWDVSAPHTHFFTFKTLIECVEDLGFKTKATRGVGIEIPRIYSSLFDKPYFYQFFPKTCRTNILLLAKK